MQPGNLFRVLGSFAIAAGGAGLALIGAAVTGNLDGGTTIEDAPSPPSATGAGSAPAPVRTALSAAAIYRLDAPGVVRITAVRAALRRRQSLGSGFVIDKAGHIVTNNDVIAGARQVRISFSGTDGLAARIVGRDPATDVAVLQVATHSRSLTPLPLGDSDGVRVGDPVLAIGNPPALSRTATAGIVSALEPTIDAPSSSSGLDRAIRIDATIDDGNTGGPLIDARGDVIGVDSELGPSTPEAAASTGVGFAIPINTVKGVVAQLIRFGRVRHAYLGASAVPVTDELARTYNLPARRGLLLQTVVPGSGAARAGLRAGRTAVVVAGESYRIGGDLIVAVDGRPVSSEEQFRAVVERRGPGDVLALELWRGGKRVEVNVRLGREPG